MGIFRAVKPAPGLCLRVDIPDQTFSALTATAALSKIFTTKISPVRVITAPPSTARFSLTQSRNGVIFTSVSVKLQAPLVAHG